MKNIEICQNPECKNFCTELIEDLDRDDDCLWCSECGKTSRSLLVSETLREETWAALIEEMQLSLTFWRNRAADLEQIIENNKYNY